MSEDLLKIYRVIPAHLQNIGINLFELKEWKVRRSKKFYETLKFLKSTERWNHEDFINYQSKHLKNIVEYSYKNIPFYHNLYKKNNVDILKIRTINDLEKLPIVKKEDVVNHWHLFQSQQREKFTTRSTAGTTGKPLTIRLSKNLNIMDKANAYRRDLWAGYDGGWIARFVGDAPIKDCNNRNFYRKSFVMKRVFFPTYCLSLETFPLIIQSLKKLKIDFLQCYPSAGYLLAKYLEITESFYPMKAVLFSSEPMYEFQRLLIEERFNTKAYGFYAQSEEVASALECEKGHYHLTMVDGITEILKNNEQVQSSEKGFSVGTSLHNYAMPLIRYEINDYTSYADNHCDCGRTLPIIYPIETRAGDFVITPSGKLFAPLMLAFPIRDIKNIIEAQFVQKTIDTILLRIVKSDNYTQTDESTLLVLLKQLLGEELSIKIEYVQKIYETSAFKKRFIINEMGKDYLEKTFKMLL